MTPLSQLAWRQLWQVTAVALGVGLLVKTSCRHRPHLAHVLWLVVLVKCLTPPLWSSSTSVFSWATRNAVRSVPTSVSPANAAMGFASISRSRSETHQETDSSQLPLSAVISAGDHHALDHSLSGSSSRPQIAAAPFPIARLLGITWLIGALAYAGYALLATVFCWRTIRTSRLPDDDRLTNPAADLSRRLGISRPVRLWIIREPLGPLSVSLMRPTVILPEALAASRAPAELEPLLAHELVHVRRRDSLFGLLQLAAHCLWWFHPLVWWANRRIDFERERCCDEEVVANLAIDPARYARALLSVLELKRQLRSMPVSPGARPFEITQRRLEHIRLRSDRFRARTPRRDWLALLALGLLLIPGAGLAGWSSQTSDRPAPPVQADTTKPAVINHPGPAATVKKTSDAEAEMHVIGVYQAIDRPGNVTARVFVNVRPTAKPVVLVVTGYMALDWHVTLADGARVKKVIMSGYFEQEIRGLPAGIPVENRSFFPRDGSRRTEGWFYAYQWNTLEWREMVRRLNELTGLAVTTFQGATQGDSFVVDGKLGREFGQAALSLATAHAPAPQDLRAASENADLHVLGIYHPGNENRGGLVDVEVRPAPKPVVLVLTSYFSASWSIKLAPARPDQVRDCGQSVCPGSRGRSPRRAGSLLLPRSREVLLRQKATAPARAARLLRRQVEHA